MPFNSGQYDLGKIKNKTYLKSLSFLTEIHSHIPIQTTAGEAGSGAG